MAKFISSAYLCAYEDIMCSLVFGHVYNQPRALYILKVVKI